ncbi:MAG: YDG domain-containing protein [Oliverpabstia sp.]
MKGKRTIAGWLFLIGLVIVAASVIILFSARNVNGEAFTRTMNHRTETIVFTGVTQIPYEEASRIQYLNFEAWITDDTDINVVDKIVKIKNPDGWSAADSENILTNISVQIDSVIFEGELYKVTGSVSFGTLSAGNTVITVSYDDSWNEDEAFRNPVNGTGNVKVIPKELMINRISFPHDRTYDGTKNINLENVILSGIVNSDEIYVSTGNEKTYMLKDSNVAEDGIPLNVDPANGGITMELAGKAKDNYTLNVSNVEQFKCNILPATIQVDLTGVRIEKNYYSENPDINALVKANADKVFSGFIVTDDISVLINSIKESYMPIFTVPANKESGTGEYNIYASDPVDAKSKALNNYQFDLRGMPVGKLIINRRKVTDDEYSFSNSEICVNESKSKIWIKKDTTNVDPIVVKEGFGYDAVVYCDQNGHEKPLDFSVDGRNCFYFMLKNKATDTCSLIKKVDFITDSHTTASITVTANSNRDAPDNFERITSLLTLGVFGNTENASASVTGSDEQSGVQAVQYVLKEYEEIQGKSTEDIKDLLEAENNWNGTADAKQKEVSFYEGRQIVFARTIDNVGNIQYAGSNGIVIDSQKPNLIKAEIKNPSDNGIYNKNVTVSFEATDILEGCDSFSGVKEIHYQAYLNGEEQTAYGWSGTISRDYVVTEQTAADLKANEEAMRFSGEFEIPYAGVVSAEPDAINCVTVRITAVDYAGNVQVKDAISFDYDIAKPALKVSFDGEAKNDIYFNADRTVTVKVTDAYFKRNDYGKSDFTGIEYACPADGYEKGWKELDNYTYEMKYCYSEDGEYYFDVSITDAAGNLSKMGDSGNIPDPVPDHYRAFIVDKTKPEITNVKYFMHDEENEREITKEIAEKERFFAKDIICAEYTVIEQNFENRMAADSYVGGLSLHVKAVDSNNNDVPADTLGSWSTNGDVHVLKVTFLTDANYTFDLTYTDKAGNQLKENCDKAYFTVDTMAPTGEIKLTSCSNVWNKIVEALTFGIFSKKTEMATVFHENDETAGVEKISVLKSHDKLTITQLNQLYADGKWIDERSIVMKPNQQAIVYGRIEDKAGNYYYVSTDGFVLDDQIGKPQIDIVTPEPQNHIYNSNVKIRIKVVDPDPTGNQDYSGLKSVYYEVRSHGDVTQSGNLNVTAGTARQKSVENVITVIAEKNNSNNVQVFVKAVDNADNISEQILDLKIDITRPEIFVTFNNNNSINGSYYQDTRTATVTIKERNFDPNNVQINVINANGTKADISGWSHSVGTGISDNTTHTAMITFSEDGEYMFSVSAADMASNKAENSYQSEKFTIDKTLPIINVSYDNNSAQNGRYYKEPRTAIISITEHNFRAEDVKVTVAASDGLEFAAIVWSDMGDHHTTTIKFGRDADYDFSVSYKDLAGNTAADYDADPFTIDCTKPYIEITGVKDKSANKGSVMPIIKINDANFSSKGASLDLTGIKKGKVNIANMIKTENTQNGKKITFQNFDSNMDDIYILTAQSVDKAGNETTKRITFSVNRQGSSYVINDTTKRLLEEGFTNYPQDIIIQEINVDFLKYIELSYSKDGQIVKLEKGKDFKEEVIGEENQWKKYTYTVFASCFDEEGEYRINISSLDEADNVNNNKVKAVNIDFVVDKTPPVMAISNLENRGRYKEDSHEYTLNVKDNLSLQYVTIYLDDKLYKNYKLEGQNLVNVEQDTDIVSIDHGKIYLNVNSKNRYQKIKIVSTDAAGNISETEDYNVLVTTSDWVQFFMNKPLFFGCITTFIILVIIIAFVIWKKKNNEFFLHRKGDSY